jgi:hypothetical protein
MSTFAVYALDDRVVVDESTPFLQEGPAFQLSRVRAEQAVWAAGARALPVTVLRAPNILGVIRPRRGRSCSLSGSSRASLLSEVMAPPHSPTLTSTTSLMPSSQRSAQTGPSGKRTTSSTDRRPGESIRIVSVSGWACPPCPAVKRFRRGAGASAARRRSGSWATSLASRMQRRCWKSSANWLDGG